MRQKIKKHAMVLLSFILLFSANIFAQTVTVTGTVTDAKDKSPLPGVSILVKGTTLGVITDFDGNYNIKVPSDSETLVFSFIGYNNQEVRIAGQSVINVALDPKLEQLEEFLVIGYGTVKKEDATGSVSAIKAEDFNQGSITSPEELLTGKISGVQITSDGGAPGSGSTIRIRGGASLNASNDPLIVIDGVPVDNEGISGMRNPLNTINPNDIETFTILKDASATAIYGSRASNGVIIITTKQGRAGQKLTVGYIGKVSMGTPTGQIEVLNANEFKDVLGNLEVSEQALALTGDANTDWQNEILQNSFGTDHNVYVSGSLKELPYRASVGYSNQTGLLKTSSLERYTGSINLSPSLFEDHLKINASIKGVYVNNRFADEGSIGSAVTFDPTQNVYDSGNDYGGYFYWSQPGSDIPNTVATTNPVALLERREDLSTVMRSIGNAKIDYKMHFLPDLNAVLNLGYDYSKGSGTVFVPENAPWSYNAVDGGGEDREYNQEKRNEVLDFYLNYAKEFNEIHSLNLMGGYTWQHFYRNDYERSTNVAGTVVNSDDDDPTEYYLVSFYGRLNYTLNNKYLITATLRQDGTSRFSPDTRWGMFPSVALGWKINEEAFLENADAVSNLKLRLGWGITGQQDLPDDITNRNYPYLATYTSSEIDARYLFGNSYYYTYRPDGFDKNIKWEETTTYNIGLDFGFLNERITGNIEVYEKDTKDLLNIVPTGAGTNFTNEILTNIGDMTNKGVELAINGEIISRRDLSWGLGFNVTYNENEITKLTASDDPTYLGAEAGGIEGGVGGNIQIQTVGYPKRSFFVFEQVYDENSNPIEDLYVDRSGDGLINISDRYHYYTPDPDVFLGFSSNFKYKKFDASLAGRANIGNYVYNNINSRTNFTGNMYWSSGYLNNVTRDHLNTNFATMQLYSDYYVTNASFLRLDNVTVGYNLDNILKVSNFRVYGTVQNVFVLTNYEGLDPEINDGIDNNVYPRPRTYMLGVSVEF